MRIVVFTSLQRSWLEEYIIAKASEIVNDVHIVAIDRRALPYRKSRLKSNWRKMRRRGLNWTLANFRDRRERSACLQDWRLEAKAEFDRLIPDFQALEGVPQRVVQSVNGPDAVEALQALNPDVVIQAGAGILKPQIFNLARLSTLNMHHGFAPRIRGGSSIFWGVYHGRPDWVGVTIHQIDAGLDTGPVFARQHLSFNYGTHPAHLFGRATVLGAGMLQEVLEELSQNRLTPLATRNEPSVYHSFFTSQQYRTLQANHWHPVDPLLEESIP